MSSKRRSLRKESYFPTGNDYVSLSTLRTSDGAVEHIHVLSMRENGLLAFFGGDRPFLTWEVRSDGRRLPHAGLLDWDRELDWIPRFSWNFPRGRAEGRFVAPPGDRGFALMFSLENRTARRRRFEVLIRLDWVDLLHSLNLTKSVSGAKFAISGSWDGYPALEFRAPFPRLALSAHPLEGKGSFRFRTDGRVWSPPRGGRAERQGGKITLEVRVVAEAGPGERGRVSACFGVAPEEIGALTSAREMVREGAGPLLDRTRRWLSERRLALARPEWEALANRNAFFNRFFAAGRTLDTDETVCLTSRSPRYYVSGAYWDRDSLLWSHPCVLTSDPPFAAEMLRYALGRQGRNMGIHSRYLSGAVLEPGFELDELCAPVIAARRQVEKGTQEVLEWPELAAALDRFERVLAEKKHPRVDLYETTLLPSDDPWPQRYVTYDNALVWRALRDAAWLYCRRGEEGRAPALKARAEAVRRAVYEHAVKEGRFAWSVDLEGGHRFYDEPPGSLLLLPFYGFCGADDPIWVRTREWIHLKGPYTFHDAPYQEVGCAHAPHPWVLSAANSLLCGEVDRALRFLRAPLDHGLACESVDERTGEPATGEAFATCAGFLAFALVRALGPRVFGHSPFAEGPSDFCRSGYGDTL